MLGYGIYYVEIQYVALVKIQKSSNCLIVSNKTNRLNIIMPKNHLCK